MAMTSDDIRNLRKKGKSAGSFSSSASKKVTAEDIANMRRPQTATVQSQTVQTQPTQSKVAESYSSLADYDKALDSLKMSALEELAYKGKSAVQGLTQVADTAISGLIPKKKAEWGIDINSLAPAYTEKEKAFKQLQTERELYAQEKAWADYAELANRADFASKSADLSVKDLAKYNVDFVKADEYSKNLSAEEKAVANYVLRDTQSADEYLAYLKGMNIKKKRDALNATAESIDRWTDSGSGAERVAKNAVVSAGTALGNTFGSLGTMLEVASGKEYDPYGGLAFVSSLSDKARQNVSENIESAVPTNWTILGQNPASFGYNTLMSVVESYIGAKTFGKGYSALMGSNAFNNTYRELIENGATESDAMLTAGLNGIFETLFEEVSLENLLKEKSIVNWKTWVAQTLKQAGVEASEETFTELADVFANEFGMGVNSDIQNRVRELQSMGYSEYDIKAQMARELSNKLRGAALGGFISGGLMGGVSNGVQGAMLKNVGINTNLDSMREAIKGSNYASELDSLEAEYDGERKSKEYYRRLGDIYSRAVNESYADLQKATNEKEAEGSEKVTESMKKYMDLVRSQKSKEVVKAEQKANKYNIGKETTVNGETAKVQSISVENGKITVQTDKGSFDVKDKSLTLATKDAEVIAMASEMTDKGKADAFVENYKGESLDAYERAFNVAYTMGKGNYTTEELTDFMAESGINNDAVIGAYEAGKSAVKTASDTLNASREKFVKEWNGKYKSGSFDTTAIDNMTLTNEETALKNIAESFSLLGINVKLIKDSSAKSINGNYDRVTNTVTFNLAARFTADGNQFDRRYVLNTMAHELTHWMEDKAPKEYKELQGYIFKAMGDAKVKDLVAKEQRKHDKNHPNEAAMSEADARSEVMARACEDMLSDGKMLQNVLSGASTNFIERLSKKMAQFFKEMGEFISNLMDGYHSFAEAAQILSQSMKTLNTARDMWAKTFEQALKYNQAIEDVVVDYSEESNVQSKFSDKATVESTESLIAMHNLGQEELMAAIELGGFALPSIAIKKKYMPHTDFGEVTIVFPKNVVNPSLEEVYDRDAWTPTFPAVEYKVSEKTQNRVRKTIEDLVGGRDDLYLIGHSSDFGYDNMQDLINRRGSAYEAYKDSKAVKYAYLKSIGENVSIPTKEKKYFADLDNSSVGAIALTLGDSTLEDMNNQGYQWYEKNPETVDKIRLMMNEAFLRAHEKDLEDKKHRDKIIDLYHHYYDEEDGKLSWRNYNNIQRAMYQLRHAGAEQILDSVAFDNMLSKYEYGEEYKIWVENLFDGVVEKKGIRNNLDYFTNSGNRRSWDALHWELTLENVVKLMLKADKTGADTFFGADGLFGVAARKFTSMEDMKKDMVRLYVQSEEEQEEQRKEHLQTLADICKSIQNREGFMGTDTAAAAVVDTIKHSKTLEGMRRYLAKEHNYLNLQEDTAERIYKLYLAIKKMPTTYYEAKPRRAVRINEIAYAVIPSNASNNFIKTLEENGIEYKEYEAGNNEDRVRVTNENASEAAGTLFSTKESSYKTDNYYKNITPASRQDAERLKMLDDRNIARYRKEIDGVFDGSLSSGKDVIIGMPSDVLIEHGVSNRLIHINQGIVRKIAYPLNYKVGNDFVNKKGENKTEGNMGGKHNLGISVVKNLPLQIADPIAITKNNETNASRNSVVLWSNWISEDGMGVMLGLVIDSKGATGLQNNISTVFQAEEDYAKSFFKDKENILYTKNKKDIEQLLSNRRYMPKAMTDDTFIQNVTQNYPKVKYSDKDSNGAALSDSQIEYFKDSKVRDDSGRLLRLYHGTRSQAFSIFKNGSGIWLTPDYKYAEEYSGWEGLEPSELAQEVFDGSKRERIFALYADIKNPLNVGFINGYLQYYKIKEISNAMGIDNVNDWDELYELANKFRNENGGQTWWLTNSAEFRELAIKHGFDGLKAVETDKDNVPTYCAFNPDQVKLVTNTNPTENADIRYSEKDSEGNLDKETNAPFFYSKLSREIDNIKAEKIGAASVVSYLKGKGVKDDEIKWSGIETFLEGKKSVSKADLQEYAKNSMLQIEEKELSNSAEDSYEKFFNDINEYYDFDMGDFDKYFDYENDFLLDYFVEDIDSLLEEGEITETDHYNIIDIAKDYASGKYESTKWSDYVTEGTTNYRELLFKMPGSDYSNRAMSVHWDEKGVLAHARIDDMTLPNGQKMLFIEEIQSDWHNAGNKEGYTKKARYKIFEGNGKYKYGVLDTEQNINVANSDDLVELVSYVDTMNKRYQASAVPDAPFKNGKYIEYVMKRLLRMAAEEGYDSIGWTTGKMQEDRWSSEYAEGYRIEYDQDMPKFMMKYGKQWGAKTAKVSLREDVVETFHNDTEIDYDDGTRVALTEDGKFYALYDSTNYMRGAEYASESSLEEAAQNLRRAFRFDKPGQEIWSVQLTDSMKQSVINEGQPMYSEKETEALDLFDENKRLKKENDILKADLEKLKEMLKLDKTLTKGKLLKESNLDAVARGLLKSARSSMDKAEVISGLKEVYGYILENSSEKGKQVDYDTMMGMAYELAKKLLRSSKGVPFTDSYYKDVLTGLRKSRIKFDEQQIQEAKSIYGDRYRDAFMGTVILSKDGISLDSLWQDWAETYPDIFDADVNSADMPAELLDIAENLRKLANQTESLNTAENAMYFAQEIYDRFWNVATVTTTADKLDAKYKKKHAEAMAKVKKSSSDALKKKDLVDRMFYGRLLAEQRAKAKEQQAELKEYIKAKDAKRKDAAIRRASIEKITDTAMTLAKWLKNNTAKEHVIEPLKVPVGRLVASIDYSSKRLLGLSGGDKSGVATNKDISIANSLLDVRNLIDKVSKAQEEGANIALDTWIDFTPELAEKFTDISTEVEKISRKFKGADNENILQLMPTEQLEEFADSMKMLMTVVRQANRYVGENNYHNMDEDGKSTIQQAEELGERNKVADNEKKLKRIAKNSANKADDFINFSDGLPYYVFKRLGKGAQRRFTALMDGQDKLAKDIKAISDYTSSVYTEEEIKEWQSDVKTITIYEMPTKTEAENGEVTERTVQMTVPQLMALYELSKREQAYNHLLGGGIVINEFKRNGLPVVHKQKTVTLTDSELNRILKENLTDRQKEVADKLQSFMSGQCSDWGNEISMQRFGIRLFTEENYFPIEVDSNALPTEPRDSQKSVYALLNMGFTKKLTQNANNPIVVNDIFSVFSAHAGDMAKYHSLALPVLNMVKWFNYKEKETRGEEGAYKSSSVKESLENAYGAAANKYIRSLLYDLNGTSQAGRNENFARKLTKMYKASAVAANLQVGLLQPLSYLRAIVTINPKYLTKALSKKPAVEKCQTNSGIAMWKAMGFYNTDISMNLERIIEHNESKTEKFVDATMRLAETMDNLTWGTLWNAVEYEVMDNNPKLAYNSAEFNSKVAERFRDIIYSTQVVDSTLTRSDLMRSPSVAVQWETAFMSEPTVSINILNELRTEFVDEYRKTRDASAALKKNGKKIAIVTSVYILQSLVESLLRAGVGKWRNIGNDDDDSYWEKFLENLKGELNPLEKIPIIKEVFNIFDGYSVTRTDTESLESMVKALQELDKVVTGEKDWSYKTTYKLMTGVSQLTGIPMAGILREVAPVWNATIGMIFPSLRWQK